MWTKIKKYICFLVFSNNFLSLKYMYIYIYIDCIAILSGKANSKINLDIYIKIKKCECDKIWSIVKNINLFHVFEDVGTAFVSQKLFFTLD